MTYFAIFIIFFSFLYENRRLDVSNEKVVDLWTNIRLIYKIKDLLVIFTTDVQLIQANKVNLLIQDINWKVPRGLSIMLLQIVEDICKINLSFGSTISDKLI